MTSLSTTIPNYIYFGGNKMFQKVSINDDTVTDLYSVLTAANAGDDNIFIYDLFIYNDSELYVTTTVDGIFTSTDAGVNITKMETLTGGNAFFKLNDNVMICLGSSSKSKSTNDGGTTWVGNYPGSTSWGIAGIYNDSLISFAKYGIYRTAVSDLEAGNATWALQTLSESESFYAMHIRDNNNVLIIGGNRNLLSTSDKGKSWNSEQLPELLINEELPDFTGISTGIDRSFAVTRRFRWADYPSSSDKEDSYYNGVIAASSDSWATWNIIDNTTIGSDTPDDISKCPTMAGCYGLDIFSVECIDSLTAYIYADWYDTISDVKKVNHSRVFKTSNGGALWTAITDDFGSWFMTAIEFKGDTGYIGGNTVLLKTVDGGNTFIDLYPTMIAGDSDSTMYVSGINMVSTTEVYISTTSNGVFYTRDGGTTIEKFATLAGANDLVKFDDNSFMVVGSSTKTRYTNDGGENWVDCYPGSSIWAAGEIMNDSLYVLCKSSIFKISVSDLAIETSAEKLALNENKLKVCYGVSDFQIVASKTINHCYLYSISGKLVSITEPNSNTCSFSYNDFHPGVYIIAAETGGVKSIEKVVIR